MTNQQRLPKIFRAVYASIIVCFSPAALHAGDSTQTINHEFLARLSTAGVLDAAEEIGLNVDAHILPLARNPGHQYDRYRWSVGHADDGGIMISALPPEEEVGWTPWERWRKGEDGQCVHESWVLYPLKTATPEGVAQWYRIDEPGLGPRFAEPPSSLEELLHRARIHEAAKVLGFDAKEILLDPLSAEGSRRYLQCRWVVIPHHLAADTPVIYVLPPMHLADQWPWESWYTDGSTPLILHVHFTKASSRTTGTWSEYANAPQRPPEIFGHLWHWYDEPSLVPTMANP
ncbi:hypothetical protein ACFSSA_14375 [Luteolibacter algae]|uniref:Uncharacterized protein n=1 Tax=Luteolibacter algae TaxID=454151 RepID=A0ABW5DBN0_9BACT